MRTFIRSVIAVIPLILTCAVAPANEPLYGICRVQIADFIEHRLGQTVTRIDIRKYSSREMIVDHGDALVYVKECPGFHHFEVYGTETVCEHIPHYGTSHGSYVRYSSSNEGCSKTS